MQINGAFMQINGWPTGLGQLPGGSRHSSGRKTT
jgi:hypothetical protein